ncbi:MAG: hypothetical protein IJL41_01700 [Clostridia bacterium]|nr:hypothetical protein [Clostridia bacterium]
MKKILIIFLTILFFATFCGCGKDEQADNIGKAFFVGVEHGPDTPESFIDESKIGSTRSEPSICDNTLEYVKSFRLGPYQTDQYATEDGLVFCEYNNGSMSVFVYYIPPPYPKSYEAKTERITIEEASDIVKSVWEDDLASKGYVYCPDESQRNAGRYYFCFKQFYNGILLDKCTIATDNCGNIFSFVSTPYGFDMESFDIPVNLEETLAEAGKKLIETDTIFQKQNAAQGISGYENLRVTDMRFSYYTQMNCHAIFYRLQFDPTFSDGRPQEYNWKTPEIAYIIGEK